MGAVSIVRAWQFRVNALVKGTYPFTALNLSQNTLWHIKESLKGSGSWTDLLGAATSPLGNWSVSFSCNSSVAGTPGDGVDRWVTPTNIVNGTGGSPRSWIVLRQPGVAPNFEICVELNDANPHEGTIVVSPNSRFGYGGGSAGSTTARPTADDEIVILNASFWGGSSSATGSNRVHVMKTADGASTRVVLARDGFVAGLWSFERPLRKAAGWENPSIAGVKGSSSPALGQTVLTLPALNNFAVFASRSLNYPSGTSFLSYLDVDSGGATVAQAPLVQVAPNDIGGDTPFWELALFSQTYGARGRNGIMVDLWAVPSNYTDGGTIPDDDSHQFIVIGSFVMPWNRSLPRWY